MKIYTNTQFDGAYPVGTAAVIIAESPEAAARLLNGELESIGLSPSAKAKDMTHINSRRAAAHILCDGEY